MLSSTLRRGLYLYLSAVHRFLRESPPVDIHIVTQETED